MTPIQNIRCKHLSLLGILGCLHQPILDLVDFFTLKFKQKERVQLIFDSYLFLVFMVQLEFPLIVRCFWMQPIISNMCSAGHIDSGGMLNGLYESIY